MKTVYLRADTKAALLAGLPFVPTDDHGTLITQDHRAGWDLDVIEPGTIVTETRDILPDDDIESLDTRSERNPDYRPLQEDGTENPDPGPQFIERVVVARSKAWHANLLIRNGSTVESEIDPAITIDPPAQSQRSFLS
ncbi:MAG: hypothetical protein AAGD23_11890 [Pseudomonadota bacterium]